MSQSKDDGKKGPVYFTIYVKNLYNGTGYIDVCLDSDLLLKDYLHFLDIGVRGHKTYAMAHVAGAPGPVGMFVINLSEIAAIAINRPQG